MSEARFSRIFETDRRIRLGIWGLGRGMSFYDTCRALNIDVVAGCDYNAHMREHFLQQNPGAFATADADAFLAQDFDAVLLATFCVDHAGDALRCLQAGKHVLSEVTAFHTLAEGVQLVEAVERSGLVYNLAENYPFSAANMYLARKWKAGLFGELMYGEYEYVHECRSLCYTYIDGVPVQPGWTVHSWRSWMNFHYYCTHSLGPVMVITGTRPVRVAALPGSQRLAGYLIDSPEGMGGVTPSLIEMDNGGVVRNLMGATTNDAHIQRLWGTRGAAELHIGKTLQLRLGASGGSPKFEVTPTWDALGALAAQTGHGGGDFWVLYYFARQIFFGDPAPFDIYSAADVTIPGIQAYRSSLEGGQPMAVPDFRDPAQRDAYRSDDWAQRRYDTKRGVFPAGIDLALAGRFSTIITELIRYGTLYRAYADWASVVDDMVQPEQVLRLLENVIAACPAMRETYAAARRLIAASPQSDGARVLREMLEIGDEAVVTAPDFFATLTAQQDALRAKFPHLPVHITAYRASALQPAAPDIRLARAPRSTAGFQPLAYHAPFDYVDVRHLHGGQDGLIYLKAEVTLPAGGRGALSFGADGPVKAWVNGRAVGSVPDATNPATPGEYVFPATWQAGTNTVLFALNTRNGHAWGVTAQAVVAQG